MTINPARQGVTHRDARRAVDLSHDNENVNIAEMIGIPSRETPNKACSENPPVASKGSYGISRLDACVHSQKRTPRRRYRW